MKNVGNIEGTIKDSDGNPVAGATVTLSNGMTATTDQMDSSSSVTFRSAATA